MHLNTVRQVAKITTNHQLTEKALFLLTLRAEEWIIEKIKDAERLLEQRNDMRKENGANPKVRITDELLNEVLKNPKSYPPLTGQSPARGVENAEKPEETDNGAGQSGSEDTPPEEGRCCS
jgi:hypothetical protein